MQVGRHRITICCFAIIGSFYICKMYAGGAISKNVSVVLRPKVDIYICKMYACGGGGASNNVFVVLRS